MRHQEPFSQTNNLKYDANAGLVATALPGPSVDRLHLYGEVKNNANPVVTLFTRSMGAYERNMQRRAKHAQKYFTYTVASSNPHAVTATITENPPFGIESVKLVDIVPELAFLG